MIRQVITRSRNRPFKQIHVSISQLLRCVKRFLKSGVDISYYIHYIGVIIYLLWEMVRMVMVTIQVHLIQMKLYICKVHFQVIFLGCTLSIGCINTNMMKIYKDYVHLVDIHLMSIMFFLSFAIVLFLFLVYHFVLPFRLR